MGCSQSTQVVESKKKKSPEGEPVVKNLSQHLFQIEKMKQIFEIVPSFLIGSLSQKQQIFANVKLDTVQIDKMSLPSGKFVSHNYSSILQIQKGKYFISGGINHDLTKITKACFFYYSKEHKVQILTQMIQARYTHSAAYFYQKNAIYIIGGRSYGDDTQAILAQCEKYDLLQEKFIELPLLNVKRCTCFVLIWKETIYAFGGYTGAFERSTLIQYLDTNESSWKILDFQINRGLEGAILLPTNDNQLTIFGGLTNSGSTDSVITINLLQKSIRSKRKLVKKRSLYKSFYKDGKVYLFGGDEQLTCEIYDIGTQKSEVISKNFPFSIEEFDSLGFSVSSPRIPYKQKVEFQNLDKSTQKDEVVYIIGTTEEPFICQLNISIPQVKFMNVPLNMKLFAHQGGVFINLKQLILFGGIQDDSLSVISSDTYIFNIETKKARKIAKMNQNRYAFTYLFYPNAEQKLDYIYCFGGATCDNEGKMVFLNTCERFSVHNHKWQLIAPLPSKLVSAMSLTFKEQIFVFGGTNQKKQKSMSIFIYSPKFDKWCQLQAKMMFGIEAGSITRVSQNQFYIFGGLLQNGQNEGIWSFYIKEEPQNTKKSTGCTFQEKGKMNEKKAQHKVYKPKGQDFYVVFGGQKNVLTFYQSNLQEETSDSLLGLKQMFMEALQYMNNKDLKGYLIVSKDSNYLLEKSTNR